LERGGVGYVQPSPESFPTLQQVSRMITACGALPTYAWLDGYSAGEQAIEELLGVMLANGVVGLTVIPERNWNYKDQALKTEHVSKLDRVMALAAKRDLPIFIGTEMNKAGQPLVDAIWSVDALKPYVEVYINGANLLYGHTVLERTCKIGYSSAWAEVNLKTRAGKNAFYAEVGRKAEPKTAGERLRRLNPDATPAQVLAAL
jgi:hypothetical protein